MILVYILLEFFCGSLMFSFWIGKLAKKDLSQTGDGNPGAFNLWNSAGFKFGIAGVFLDFIKGYFPLVVLVKSGIISNYEIVPVAIAPVIGHAFSPLLKFNGGKAIAVTFGVWSALTNFEVSLVFAIILALLQIVAKICFRKRPITTEVDAFMVILGMLLVLPYLYIRHFELFLIILWIINISLVSFKNKDKLSILIKRHQIKN